MLPFLNPRVYVKRCKIIFLLCSFFFYRFKVFCGKVEFFFLQFKKKKYTSFVLSDMWWFSECFAAHSFFCFSHIKFIANNHKVEHLVIFKLNLHVLLLAVELANIVL